MKKQNCIICRKPLNNNGIMIYGRGICKCCEKRLVNLQNDDIETDFYNYYKECMKKIIVYTVVNGGDINCRRYHF